MPIDVVTVTIATDSQAVDSQGFQLPMYVPAPGSLSALGFTERLRKYGRIEDVNSDANLPQQVKDDLAIAFSQVLRTGSIAVGRVEDNGSAQVVTWTVAGTIADPEVFTVYADGVAGTYTSAPADTPALVAAGVRAALTSALATASSTLVVGGAGADITVTAAAPGDFFSYSEFTDSAAGTLTSADTELGVDLATELQAVFDFNSDWYHFSLEIQGSGHILAASAWCEPIKRVLKTTSADEDIVTASTTDVASAIQTLNREYTSIDYYSVVRTPLSLAWSATFLEPDPDLRRTIGALKTLEGIAPDPAMTTAKQAFIEGKDANLYWTANGIGATWRGRMASSRPMDERLTIDWIGARVDEDVTQLLLDYSNRNDVIPYTPQGIEVVRSTVLSRLLSGEGPGRPGHFLADSSSVTLPVPFESIPAATKQSRELTLNFETTFAGAIETVVINGVITQTL